MRLSVFILTLLLALPASAANNAVNGACRQLCDGDSDCVRKCVGQAELFELRAEFIRAVTEWTVKPDDRMRALRSGANLEILDLCKRTGWSLENMMICLRSYPTRDVIKNCKKLSTLQEEQVQCVRLGKTEAEIDACVRFVPAPNFRLTCLEHQVSMRELKSCDAQGGDSRERMRCLERAEQSHLAQEGAPHRGPSSVTR
jgi:hypothetical protein